MPRVIAFFVLILLQGCNQKNETSNTPQINFTTPVKVQINGYNGNSMEPFLSRDGSILLFNNLNALPENTNLHWAKRINDSSFDYQGEVSGVNTADLEGVPSLDKSGNLYFVSTRNFSTTLSTLYQAKFSNGVATDVQLVNGISKQQAAWINFDVEVSENGETLYFVDGMLAQSGIPTFADLVIAQRNGPSFTRLSNSASILKNINTSALEYAACISVNQLELYFTRLSLPVTASSAPEIFISTRQNTNEPFGKPQKIEGLGAFVEATTIAPDQITLYYHRKENDKFELFTIRKK